VEAQRSKNGGEKKCYHLGGDVELKNVSVKFTLNLLITWGLLTEYCHKEYAWKGFVYLFIGEFAILRVLAP
jgi:hypothetical protein